MYYIVDAFMWMIDLKKNHHVHADQIKIYCSLSVEANYIDNIFDSTSVNNFVNVLFLNESYATPPPSFRLINFQ